MSLAGHPYIYISSFNSWVEHRASINFYYLVLFCTNCLISPWCTHPLHLLLHHSLRCCSWTISFAILWVPVESPSCSIRFFSLQTVAIQFCLYAFISVLIASLMVSQYLLFFLYTDFLPFKLWDVKNILLVLFHLEVFLYFHVLVLSTFPLFIMNALCANWL